MVALELVSLKFLSPLVLLSMEITMFAKGIRPFLDLRCFEISGTWCATFCPCNTGIRDITSGVAFSVELNCT